MKFSVLMPYLNRAKQLEKTLESFADLYPLIGNFLEIIIIEDPKNQDTDKLIPILNNFGLRFPIIHRKGEHVGYNPAPLFNQAAKLASGKFFVLTSPEVMHTNNVLGELELQFSKTPDAYLICACQSFRAGRFHRWFQHSVHRPRLYHFCSALSAANYWKVGGFDEWFGDGFGFDDDDFRDTVIEAGIRVICKDELITIHQEHVKGSVPNYSALHARNKALWLSKNPDRKRWLSEGWEKGVCCG